jgi:hypothetical protein
VKKNNPSSVKHKKNNLHVPAELNCLVYLPGVGSVADYIWFEPQPDVEPSRAAQRGVLNEVRS